MNLSRYLFAGLIVAATSLGIPADEATAQDVLPLEVVGVDGGTVYLTFSELDALEQTEFVTETIWTDGKIAFTGVPIRKILDHVGAGGEKLVLSALNDYTIEMPVAEIDDDAPIVATRMDGEIMSVRDKGPYWVIYPFDDHPAYRTETNHARSVWQLARITLLE